MQCDAFDSAALKKHSSTPCLDGKDIRVLLSPEISISGPRCRGPQGTLTDWLCTVIDSNSSTQSTLPLYEPLTPQGTHLIIWVGGDIFIRTTRF